ncbi:hypothetical protein AURDEDRAFT_85350 [Auricularia subglabra TFB-10046 SS5]|nr:hypothetical protein AURDEDRAFT_85350 [Auricularia subglabra TFB-10046 SS5]
MTALDALQRNATRLTERIQESFSETTRGTFGNARSLDALDASDDKLGTIKKQLDSRADADKLDAMRRLIAAVSKGRNVSSFFPDVVKNVVSPNLEIRKLVYIFLIRHAESEPDLALLSVNTFQKDLADPNPPIRAMALRVLSSIRVPMIASIVALAIKKAAADTSPYVRKAAALAIPKCFSLDTSQQSVLLAILTPMLADRSPLAVGSVATAFNALCPERLDLLHPHFRRLSRLLVDVDEWGQIVLLDLLARYARTMLARPPAEESGPLDADLQLLLTSSEPLFSSRNAAVVLAASRAYYYLAPPTPPYLTKLILPLLRLLHQAPEIGATVCADLGLLAREHPELLAPHVHRLYVRADDLPSAALEKLRILSAIADHAPEYAPALLREFEQHTRAPDERIVRAAVRAVGRIAANVPECTMQCVALLLKFIQDAYAPLVTSAILALKTLVQTQKVKDVVPRLAERLQDIRDARARACVVWLVGQYDEPSSDGRDFAPDVLRLVARGFTAEGSQTKLAALTLAAKLLSRDGAPGSLHPSIQPLAGYVFALAHYDADVDVRDRARILSSLVERAALIKSASLTPPQDSEPDEDAWRSGVSASYATEEEQQPTGVVLRAEQVRLVLRSGKHVPSEAPLWPSSTGVLGSLALMTGRHMGASRALPDWPDEGTDGALRDVPEERPVTPLGFVPRGFGNTGGIGSGSGSGLASPLPSMQMPATPTSAVERKGPWRDLDEFYADAEEGSEEEDDEDESEDDEEESEEEEIGASAPLVGAAAAATVASEEEDSEEEDSGSDDDERTDDARRVYR